MAVTGLLRPDLKILVSLGECVVFMADTKFLMVVSETAYDDAGKDRYRSLRTTLGKQTRASICIQRSPLCQRWDAN